MNNRVAAAQDPTQRPEGGRLHFLDALRGIAAVYVVFFHLVYVGGVAAPKWLSGLMVQGGSGVMLFFVVSCFSLFFTMPARMGERYPLLSFYLHRFFRIAPLFYVWLAISCTLILLKFHLPLTVPLVLQNIFFVFNLVPGSQTGIVMASWTIGVEMLFYVMFPFIYLRVQNLVQACSLVLLCLILYFGMVYLLPILPVSREVADSYGAWFVVKDLPIFSMGAVCYFLIVNRLGKPRGELDRSLGTLLLLAAACLFVMYSSGWLSDQIFAGNPYIWTACAYSLLIVGLSLNPIRLLVNRVTRFFGKISYSLYLAHGPVILLLHPWFVRLGQHQQWPHTKYFAIATAGLFVIATPVAYTTYRLIEVPFIRLGKRAYGKILSAAGPVRESVTLSEA